ncbi:MAG TPA: PIN domain-containing protein [Candidatus Angelobacter sp.]|nr:PIN domain-containing protein [Candidatus Angelobacter sp.]
MEDRPSVQILLDTSFLLTMLKQHRDPEEEIKKEVAGKVRILTLDLVVFELEKLSRRASPKTQAFAEASLELLKKRKIPVLDHKPGPTDVDAALIACALTEKKNTGIATVDRELRTALAAQGAPIIYPKARRGLVARGFQF